LFFLLIERVGEIDFLVAMVFTGVESISAGCCAAGIEDCWADAEEASVVAGFRVFD